MSARSLVGDLYLLTLILHNLSFTMNPPPRDFYSGRVFVVVSEDVRMSGQREIYRHLTFIFPNRIPLLISTIKQT